MPNTCPGFVEVSKRMRNGTTMIAEVKCAVEACSFIFKKWSSYFISSFSLT